jgi:hypothetical protein
VPLRPKLARRALNEPHPSRLPADPIQRQRVLDAHQKALDAGQFSYVDPLTGMYVFTATAHVARGYCCDSGCRHCPYVG